MEPAPIGAAKEGAAGSVIVAKRRDSRVQRRANCAAAAAIFCSSYWAAVFAQQLWMSFGKTMAYEPGYAYRLVAPETNATMEQYSAHN